HPGRWPSMREARVARIVFVVTMAVLLAAPPSILQAEPQGYFSCRTIVFFEPCPGPLDSTDDPTVPDAATRSAETPDRARAQPATESLWVEPRAAGEDPASSYVPPRPVREFLEAPTAERAEAYLRWNQQRLQAIARAAEVLRSVTVADTQRRPGSAV